MHENLLQLQCLEKEAADLRREKHELFSDLEAVKMEKKHLQVVLETALEEKKHMTDRINQFTIIGKCTTIITLISFILVPVLNFSSKKFFFC